VVCTGRGKHDPVPLRRLQLVRDGDAVRVLWRGGDGPAPETGFRAADGMKTLEFACRTCGRHAKYREDRLTEIVRVLAEHQETAGNTPVVVDISSLERA
jgi:hypothetical protein